MSDITQAREALLDRILNGAGHASTFDRRAAFNNSCPAGSVGTFGDKVAKHAHMISDEDINAVRASGLSEDQVFEIAVCFAIGQASRQYETALGALAEITRKQ